MVTAERTTAQPASGRTTADAYAARFGHGGERHARLAGPDTGGASEEIATPLTGEAARAHLRGEVSIGLHLRDGQDRATVGLVAHAGYRTAYDDDGHPHRAPEDGIAVLQEARQRLALQGIDAAVERAPQGGRLWVFTSEPVPSEDLHALLRMATRGQEVEVYPRPARDEAAQPAVRAPLGVHPAGGPPRRRPPLRVRRRGGATRRRDAGGAGDAPGKHQAGGRGPGVGQPAPPA